MEPEKGRRPSVENMLRRPRIFIVLNQIEGIAIIRRPVDHPRKSRRLIAEQDFHMNLAAVIGKYCPRRALSGDRGVETAADIAKRRIVDPVDHVFPHERWV